MTTPRGQGSEPESRGPHRAATIGVAVVRWGDRVLIGQRPPGAPLAGLWEFPGGKVRPDESPAEAAVRECREETGLEVRIQRRLALVEHTYEHGKLELHFFAAALPRDAAEAERRPGRPFCWVDVGSLPRYALPEANRTVIRLLTGEKNLLDGR